MVFLKLVTNLATEMAYETLGSMKAIVKVSLKWETSTVSARSEQPRVSAKVC